MLSIPNLELNEMLNSFDNFLFDADGVLWLGNQPIPGAIDFINLLVNKNKNVYLISNNSTKTLEDYGKKLVKLGFNNIPLKNVFTPAIVGADYISKNRKSNNPAYVIGTSGLGKTLRNAGVDTIGIGEDHFGKYTKTDFLENINLESPVSAVVVSYDNHFSYTKMMKAANYLINEDVLFIVTNEDKTFPGPNPSVIIPGSGSMAAAVIACAPRSPIVIGKPHTTIFEYMKTHIMINESRTIMFGDRLDTDIAFAHNNGLKSCLVETGIHKLSDVLNLPKDLKNRNTLIPHYIISNFKVFI
ncbi:2-phosphoglycolate phosphatase, eukaryotic family and HAD-superfamily hydrolase, subfamily IIA and HAD-like domain and Nitrophenylphosphatase-like domain-containing protein [Strongyloides ratti]|uniref:2-phosphoglycolate phosphatase, eukaryotic family and HAD-superfamily hydrolase, subfamily IIA and HAD-like domain and Nitrophenylphosphatase-like domain-containing protein n=1 Tax=Strongyloides ratti TaxID=34506 RepID=A0A090KWA6_STRRB|nr:2-phosphoglycolate phosphatase, eukaryotic family and HAD-superfamily hydrolase, subfamily IIA and HAD-like domain and Nitrophenylphosphatase-like domain-containing protein [Strongyloides ratti]CEF61770.1 2-phosphoglycolate phosphatase, eukaryotic family and HAD-superfamily hydrolase, subfamily IIA and HAD-like domain and Nitrophenylphosphatase-like domain-containing protein [Strongyloides ratti]